MSSNAVVQSAPERAMAELLVQVLNLEAVEPAAIEPAAPLFGHDPGALGLDSIDALEIALAIQQHYGVELRSDDDRSLFSSLRALTAGVQARRSA